MNNSPRNQRPVVRCANPNQPRVGQGNNNPQPRRPENIIRPKPPSQSRAPWDVTRWVDPIGTHNPRAQQSRK